MNQTPQYSVGDTITYATFGGDLRTVKVQGKDVNIKNCEPGFDAQLVGETGDGSYVWGYDHQIVSVDAR